MLEGVAGAFDDGEDALGEVAVGVGATGLIDVGIAAGDDDDEEGGDAPGVGGTVLDGTGEAEGPRVAAVLGSASAYVTLRTA